MRVLLHAPVNLLQESRRFHTRKPLIPLLENHAGLSDRRVFESHSEIKLLSNSLPYRDFNAALSIRAFAPELARKTQQKLRESAWNRC